MRLLPAALILLALLSGCADPKSQATPDAPPVIVTADAFQNADESETGEVAGRTVDDEFLPLANVLVTLQGTSATATTTNDGVFFFAKVPARGYTLTFTKNGYETVNQSLVVNAQQRVNIQALLRHIADTSPFVDESFLFRGHINCSVRANATGTNTNPECGAVRPETDTQRNSFMALLPGVNTILVEVEWQSSIPAANEQLTLALRPFQGESWRQVQGSSPLRVWVRPADFAEIKRDFEKDYATNGGELQFFIFPGETVQQEGTGAGTTIQQDFTIYATAWYRMDPPAEFTRLAPE